MIWRAVTDSTLLGIVGVKEWRLIEYAGEEIRRRIKEQTL